MINSQEIQLSEKSQHKGLYESFYFRGNALDGGLSFWIKHNLLLYKKTQEVVIESTLVLFQGNRSSQTKSYKLKESIPLASFLALKEKAHGNWSQFGFLFSNGSFFKIDQHKLEAKLITEDGEVSWNLQMNPSEQKYYHFSNDKFYRFFFPKKKILTHDRRILFTGELKSPSLEGQRKFLGMNGHNWGTEHAYRYCYANCNQFKEDDQAYFDGFSAKILLGGILKSPYLSLCSLITSQGEFHFNDVLQSYKHKVMELSEKRWEVLFVNQKYMLKVVIEGEGTEWAHLTYDHPSGKQSVVNNTKFARGRLEFYRHESYCPLFVLTSDYFELESLVPFKSLLDL